MDAPATTNFHKTLGYPLFLPEKYPLTALPMDILRSIFEWCDRATVEVLFATCHTWRRLASELPRSKDEMCGVAAYWGHQKVILWARSQGAPWEGGDHYPYNTCEMAIIGKHPEVFRWARDEQQAPYSKTLCMNAAVSVGNLELMQELWNAKTNNSGKKRGFTELQLFYLVAIEQGQLEALKWLHAKCQLNLSQAMAETAVNNGRLPVLQWLISEGVLMDHFQISAWAAVAGQLEILQWTYHSNRQCWKSHYVVAAAPQSSNIKMLEWLYPLPECTFTSHSLEIAAAHGNLAGLQFLRSKHIPWTEDVCTAAAKANRPKTLEWAMNNGAPYSGDALYATAVSNGHKEVVDLLVSCSLPFPKNICEVAKGTAILEHLLKNNAPVPADLALHYARQRQFDLVRCLSQNQVAIDSGTILQDGGVDQDMALRFFRELNRDMFGDS